MLFGSAHQLYSLYDVVEKTVVVSTTQNVVLANADPNRVCIIFCLQGGTVAQISTRILAAGQFGLSLVQNAPIQQLTIHDNPVLCQMQWNAPPQSSAGNIVVITIAEHPIE